VQSADPPPHPSKKVDGDWTKFGTSQAPTVCTTSGEYFRVQTLTCVACPSGESVSADGLGCQCVGNTIRTSTDPADTVPSVPVGSCMSCATVNKTATWDRTTCMACDTTNGATFDANQNDCVCAAPATQVVVELDETNVRFAGGKRCETCPTGSFPSPTENGVCFSCPTLGHPSGLVTLVYDTDTQQCECPTSTPGCFDPATNAAKLTTEFAVNIGTSANTLNFYGLGASVASVTVTSLHMTTHLIQAAADCRNFANRTQCEHVANMCVMTHYDTGSVACKLYSGLFGVHPASTPRLFYDAGVDYTSMTDLELSISQADSGTDATGNTVKNLEFVVSVTTLSGTWLGMKSMGKLFQLCGGKESERDAWTSFGANYYNSCELSVEDALTAARGFGMSTAGETLFFDLYIQDLGGLAASTTKWPERLYPVPIFVENAPGNANSFSNDDFFVRRFFVIDEQMGVETVGAVPKAVSYARTFFVTTRMLTGDNQKIYVPNVRVTYASRDPSFEYVATDTVSFTATYTSSTDGYWDAFLGITCAVFCVAAIYWRYSIVKVSRRRQVLEPDAVWAGHAVGVASSAIAFGCFIVLFWSSSYFFTLYKAQTEVYVMVPLDGTSVVTEFEVMLDVAVAFAAIAMAHTLYWQCNTDIFFLDWERPWTSAASAAGGKADAAPVSAWRKMFIANEWNELQAMRLTSRELTLLLLVLILEGLNYRNLGVVEPTLTLGEPKDYQQTSSILRFFVASGFMLFIVVAQVVYKMLFHHNYVEHPIQQFVDLLAMSNLSIVILDDECAGYYLHGRSLMTFADTSLSELMAQMRKEQEMQVAARGLVPSAQREELAENQCFELFITKELRLAYESKLLRSIEETAAARGGDGFGGALGVMFGGGRRSGRNGGHNMGGGMGGGSGGFGGGGGWGGGAGGMHQQGYGNNQQQGMQQQQGINVPAPTDASLAAAEEIGDIFKQLISFVETNASSFVLERPFTNRLINMPPESVSSMQGASPIFYHDLQMSFQRTLFYGIETQLFIFDVLVFTALDKALNSFALAAFITWAIGATVDHMRSQFGSANISRKSLIDERFLI
jgi:meckelin